MKKYYKNIYLNVFLWFFQSSMRPRKLRCDVHSGTTQRLVCPYFVAIRNLLQLNKIYGVALGIVICIM
jgi:hypothetical protein